MAKPSKTKQKAVDKGKSTVKSRKAKPGPIERSLYKPIKLIDRKPFPRLPETTARADVVGYRCVLGCQLPLSLGGIQPKQETNYSDKKLLKAIKHNGTALLGLMTKVMGPAASNNMSPRSFSINRIFYVRVSELVPCSASNIFMMKAFDPVLVVLQAATFALQTAVQMCRRHGYRMVLINDVSHLPTYLQFLSQLFLMCRVEQSGLFRITLSLDALSKEHPQFFADYRTFLNTGIFQVVNDVQMDHHAASSYLTFCLMHQLPFVQELQAIDKPNVWLKAERKRIARCLRPLIILDKQFPLTLNNVDQELARLVPLAKYCDVLIRRKK